MISKILARFEVEEEMSKKNSLQRNFDFICKWMISFENEMKYLKHFAKCVNWWYRAQYFIKWMNIAIMSTTVNTPPKLNVYKTFVCDVLSYVDEG